MNLPATLLFAVALFLSPFLRAAEPPPGAPRAAATPEPPSEQKWGKAIADFEKADREHSPKPGGILFIGSSSIRKWTTLAEDFAGQNVLNRGFGGSFVEDSVAFTDRLVIPYAPRQIVFYAGGNDINAGRTPETVAKNFQAFATKVHAALPETKIAYIAISPNLKRWSQIEQVRAANALIERFCAEHRDYLEFINTFAHMLGADGKPLPDIFVEDGLHMNPKGYAIWTEVIRPHLLPEK